MESLFYPRAILVVGVSEKSSNLGALVVRNLKSSGFGGPVYAAGRTAGTVAGYKIYDSLPEVPRPVDLALILVPAESVPSVVEQCGQLGVKWVVVMSSGFSERSPEGQELERAMVAVCERYGMGLVGPNCVGVLNTGNGLAGTFLPVPPQAFRKGPVSILAQSGSVAAETTVMLSQHKVGFSKCVSLGNKLTTGEVQLLEYLIDDDSETRQIAMYLESIADGRDLLRVARRSEKPIVLYKSNIVPGGNMAAKSHTAALASDDAIVDSACRQANIVRARSFDQLIDYTKVLALPPMLGDNAGIVVHSGGAGVVTEDYCHLHRLRVPQLPDAIMSRIEGRTSTRAIRRRNPLDLGDTFDMNVLLEAVESFLKAPEIDGMLVSLADDPDLPYAGPPLENVIDLIGKLTRRFGKPVAVSFAPIMQSIDIIRAKADFPVFSRPEEAVDALAASRDYWRRREHQAELLPLLQVDHSCARRMIENALVAGRTALHEEAMAVLSAYGIDIEPQRPASTTEEAVAIAGEIGYPLAMKILSPQISHKSDVGGVALGLKSAKAVASAFGQITARARSLRPGAEISGVTLQRMVTGGKEIIIGSKWDEQFGPVVMAGIGGTMVELFNKVAFRVAPLRYHDAVEMLEESQVAQFLSGFRGGEVSDVDALIDALLRLSRLAADFPEIAEIDINPLKVFASGSGCRAVDARIFLRAGSSESCNASRTQQAVGSGKK